METIKTTFIEKIERTPTVTSFRFTLTTPFHFLPGQFVKVLFNRAEPSDSRLNKALSLSSSPLKPWIELTKRISKSEFSKHLLALQKGDSLYLQGPMGNCVLKEEYQKICFLVGGIGITPVISILEYSAEKKLPIQFSLFYSNRSKEEIAFKEELEQLQKRNLHLKIIHTITECPPLEKKECDHGYINSKLVSGNLSDPETNLFFLFGPPQMVKAMQSVCQELGCHREMLKMEYFTGYEA
jgi:ferredoxin-NADP reductase